MVRVTRPVNGVVGTVLYEALDARGRAIPGPRIAVVGIMHGNEPVGDGALKTLEETVDANLVAGSILAIRANLAAFEIDERHTPDGVDMNRQWDRANLDLLGAEPIPGECYEHGRTRELWPMLVDCDCVMDLHSTSRPSPQCLLFRDDQRHYDIARRLGVLHLVTGLHESAILDGGMCSNVGLVPGEQAERLGFTYEAGQHTAPGNVERAWEVVVRLLALLEVWAERPPPSPVRPRVYEVVERFRQAPLGSEPYRFVGYEGGEPGGGRIAPLRALESFELVEADEVVLRRGRSGVVRAQAPFTMIMPCPTAAPGTDLYYVTQRRHGGMGTDLRTDAEARREARAIERMLDLTCDDELESGGTWVSFDSRQVLDLCADLIGRALRLRPDDPHRQITVVGRGDWGGDEAERRAGQRYRQAMRAAMEDDIPITRYQLLRGAALGWLDTLTQSTAALADRRGDGMRLILSTLQPNTVSLLVMGDLERGLATGDLRHVRVAVVVEAATVEPDGADALVRVVRMGVFSSRRELLESASSLLVGLREEHRALTRTLVGQHPEIGELIGPDGAIEARPSTDLTPLRDVLYDLQLRLWTDILQHEVATRAELPDEASIGAFLARTMAATGILDSATLRSLLVTQEDDAFVVDPESLLAAADPDDFRRIVHERPQGGPTQPLLSSDVDADNLERWIGWRRFTRNVQVIPGTRGKDLDLAYSAESIQRRIARWFRWARQLALRRPGQVMVVVAGDGLSPIRERRGTAWDVVVAHRALLLDPNVAYLRIQNARGTHLAWMKDVVETLGQRREGQPVSLTWEEEHGATVNLLLVAVRSPESAQHPWSLDGWDLKACSLLLSDLEGRGARDYKLALFTDAIDGFVPNPELLHFGRSHCEGLLDQAGRRVRGQEGAPSREAMVGAITAQLANWIERVRGWNEAPIASRPDDPEERVRWVKRQLGLADPRLARILVAEMDRSEPAIEAANALWERVEPWPGALWEQLRHLD